MYATVEEAIRELQAGRPIIVVDDENRENEGDFLALAEKTDGEMINFMATEGRGLICLPMTESRAKKLNFHPMVERNTDPYGTAFTVSIDHASCHTGISAFERADTIQRAIASDATQAEFKRPGHIFPLIAKDGGVLRRAGHTEAAVDLARLAGSKEPAGVICEIMNEDGTMARMPDLQRVAKKHNLVILTIEALIRYRRKKEQLIERIVETKMPTSFGEFRAVTYVETLTNQEHIAFVKGDIDSSQPVLVRVHSECLTGDVFGSERCDCGPQLHAALRQIEEEGTGILLYMRQEGRGIGLVNKMRAYKLQEEGLDTVEANEALGFPDDLRDYGVGAQILKDLGVRQMRLLTNNPRKITSLTGHGLEIVERVAIEMPVKEANARYMETKKEKLGHMLEK